MSRYEYERGEFKLPAGEWAAFKKRLLQAHERFREEVLTFAEQIHAHLHGPQFKGKRNVDWRREAEEFTHSTHQAYGGWSSPVRRSSEEIREAALDLLEFSANPKTGQTKRPPKPQKKRLEAVHETRKVVNRGDQMTFDAGDGGIYLDNRTHTVRWEVSENNHACEYAREHPMGKAFFAALNKVQWTRTTGGEIWGNDEYNEDSGRDYAGGGGSYTKGRWGQAEREYQSDLDRMMGRSRKGLGTRRGPSFGFTLIELLIVVVIISILAGIAYPSYMQYVDRSHRTDAQTALLEIAQHMERHYTMNNTYATATLPAEIAGRVSADRYTIQFVATPTAQQFTVQAVPTGRQINDACGTLSLSSDGARAPATGGCWP